MVGWWASGLVGRWLSGWVGGLVGRWAPGQPPELACRRVPARSVSLALAGGSTQVGSQAASKTTQKRKKEEATARSGGGGGGGRCRQPHRWRGGLRAPPAPIVAPHGLLGTRRHGQNHLAALPGAGGEGPARQGHVSGSGGSRLPSSPRTPTLGGLTGGVGDGVSWVLCFPCSLGESLLAPVLAGSRCPKQGVWGWQGTDSPLRPPPEVHEPP